MQEKNTKFWKLFFRLQKNTVFTFFSAFPRFRLHRVKRTILPERKCSMQRKWFVPLILSAALLLLAVMPNPSAEKNLQGFSFEARLWNCGKLFRGRSSSAAGKWPGVEVLSSSAAAKRFFNGGVLRQRSFKIDVYNSELSRRGNRVCEPILDWRANYRRRHYVPRSWRLYARALYRLIVT